MFPFIIFKNGRLLRKVPKKGLKNGIIIHEPLPRSKKCTSSMLFTNHSYSTLYKMTRFPKTQKQAILDRKQAIFLLIKHIFTRNNYILYHKQSIIWPCQIYHLSTKNTFWDFSFSISRVFSKYFCSLISQQLMAF